MTNPTTPEDKIDEVIEEVFERGILLGRGNLHDTNAATAKAEARTALLALLNEARAEGENAIWGKTYAFLHSQDRRLCEDWEEELRATTPKEEPSV